MTQLIPYDLARTALAEAKSFDDVKEIMDRAEAMAIYYRRANDRTMEVDAIEIRMFAQRRYGQMLAAQKESGLLSRGRAGAGRPRLGGADDAPPKPETAPSEPLPTLRDLGISKQFSSRSQKMAALPPEQFEAKVATWREEALTSDRVTTNLLEVGREDEQRQARRDLAQALSDASLDLTGERQYPAGYIDFPWRRKQGVTDRSYENHYPTMTWSEIIAWCLKWRERFLNDAWFYIWIPRAHMFALHPVPYTIKGDDGAIYTVDVPTPLAWAVARALGADAFSTAFIWTKTDEDHPDDIGSGILVRDQDEVLLLFKKGRGLPKPKTDEIFGSNHRERSKPLGHSRKPQFYRDMIVAMTGGVPVLECFARHDAQFPLPANWDSWGNQSAPTQSEAAE